MYHSDDKNQSLILIILLLFMSLSTYAQEIKVTDNKGTIKFIRNNQVTSATTAPLGPLEGDVWYNTTNPTSTINIWDGTSWLVQDLESDFEANFWSFTGNSGTNSSTNFAGTIDAQDFVLRSNNVEKLRLFGTKGQVLINQAPTFNDHPLVIRANGNDILAFQDATGTPTWHWSLLDDGLNFVESNPTTNPVPLRIRPNTTTPNGTNSGEFHVATDGLLYTYDENRTKWLSVDRTMIGWGRKSNKVTNDYLRQIDGTDSDKTGWRMIRNGTITAITVQGDANQTYSIQIRKNNVATAIATLTVTNAQGNHSTTINTDFDEGDFLQCYLNGNSIDFPQVLIETTWRRL